MTQPLSLWDWLRRFWWLWLPLLLFLLWLLWRWWQSRQPWGEGVFISAPPECNESKEPLKGIVDVGTLFGEERLKGLKLRFEGNRVVLDSVPVDVNVKQSNLPVEPEGILDWDDKVTFLSWDGKELGTLSVHPKNR